MLTKAAGWVIVQPLCLAGRPDIGGDSPSAWQTNIVRAAFFYRTEIT